MYTSTMRYYFFDRHYGHDRVAEAVELATISPWDFFEARGIGYGVCLGESISWMEQASRYQEKTLSEAEIVKIWVVMSDEALRTLHWFTQHRFCTYKKAMPLRISNPEEWAKRVPKNTKKKKKNTDPKEQELIIYPNMWSIMNDPAGYMSDTSTLVLHSQSTKKQKAEAYRWLQSGAFTRCICTPSQIFQDWQHLTKITLHQQHTRYYKNQQDPRYHAVDVVKKLAQVYDADLDLTWYDLEQ